MFPLWFMFWLLRVKNVQILGNFFLKPNKPYTHYFIWKTLGTSLHLFINKVYIHGGSFMLGGYIGAGPRKLLERDMVILSLFSNLKSYNILYNILHIYTFTSSGACVFAVQGRPTWFPLSPWRPDWRQRGAHGPGVKREYWGRNVEIINISF